MTRFPRLFLLEINKQVSVVEKLSGMLFSSFRRELRGVEMEQGNMLLALLEMVYLSPILDRWF